MLDRQPVELRRFLLETSVLERLSGPLCDAVTGQTDGGSTLATLERQNLLIVPLDDRRHWYRYHLLFADVLRSRLLAEPCIDVSELAPTRQHLVRAGGRHRRGRSTLRGSR